MSFFLNLFGSNPSSPSFDDDYIKPYSEDRFYTAVKEIKNFADQLIREFPGHQVPKQLKEQLEELERKGPECRLDNTPTVFTTRTLDSNDAALRSKIIAKMNPSYGSVNCLMGRAANDLAFGDKQI